MRTYRKGRLHPVCKERKGPPGPSCYTASEVMVTQTSAISLTEEQDTKSIWHPDLNERNGVAFHVATCEVLQAFPKVMQDTEPPRAAPAAYDGNAETKGLLLHYTVFRNCCNKSSAEIQGSRDL